MTNGASPDWMQRRLKAAGQRPISALVDITNYLMLGYGRPAHVYDLAKLTGPVVARRARSGEQVLALNEKTYTLDDTMTVIADDSGVHDIAGIMGGEHSGVAATHQPTSCSRSPTSTPSGSASRAASSASQATPARASSAGSIPPSSMTAWRS